MFPTSCDSSTKIKNLKVTHNLEEQQAQADMLWFIHKDKEFESYSQHVCLPATLSDSCDSSTKIKNLKVTHNWVY